MKKISIIKTLASMMILISFSNPVFGSLVDVEAGTDYVIENICLDLFSDSQKQECLQKTRNNFYEIPAVVICEGLFSPSSKLGCLDSIKNKTFLKAELKLCNNLFSESSKVNCLKTGGQDFEIKSKIERMEADLELLESKMLRVNRLADKLDEGLETESYRALKRTIEKILDLSNLD